MDWKNAKSDHAPRNQLSRGVWSVAGILLMGGMSVASWAADSECLPAPSGLVSWWRAEGDAADSVGNNSGVLRNGVTFLAGATGQAFNFNGASQFVELTNNPSLNPSGSFSIEAWLYSKQDQQGVILGKWGDTGDYSNNRSYVLYTTPNRGLGFSIADAANQWNSAFVLFEPRGVLPLNSWVHLAAVYDQETGTRRLFVNGAQIAQRTDHPITVLNSVAKTTIGAQLSSSTSVVAPFNGLIDEISFYSKALNLEEINAIYRAGAASKCATPTPPVIISQPASQTVPEGGDARFAVIAVGTPPVTYQWRFNGQAIANATNADLTVSGVATNVSGGYSVIVANLVGAILSSNATLTVIPAQPCIGPPVGLVSWWRAEGDTTDAIGTNPATLRNGAGFATGKVGTAFSFNGVNQFVVVTNHPSLNPSSSFTIEGWVLPRQDRTQVIVGKWGDTGDSSGQRSYILDIQAGGGLEFGISDAARQGDGSFHVFRTAGNIIRQNEWQHLAAVYDQGTGARRIYVNGTKVAERVDPPITLLNGKSDVAIGANLPSSTASRDYFFGLIDELSFYGRALSADELQAIYGAGSAGKCNVTMPPFVLRQPLDQTTTLGSNATLTVQASGTAPVIYQWRFNGMTLKGATDSTLVLTNIQLTQAGSYSVEVVNAVGTVMSSNAVLRVVLAPAAIQASNVTSSAGLTIAVPITLTANGDENALSFSLNFNTNRLRFNGVRPSLETSGASIFLNTNQLALGRLGIALALPPATVFSAGTRKVFEVSFESQLLLDSGSVMTPISFGDVPTSRALTDSAANALPVNFVGGTVTLSPSDLEGDVAPRPNGDRRLSISDWVLIGRFAARLDSPTDGMEFQRADCAPRETLGDGQIKVTDWVQAGRNAAGIDASLVAGGPTSEVILAAAAVRRAVVNGSVPASDAPTRIVRIVGSEVRPNKTFVLAVNLEAQGDENAVGLSLVFDPEACRFGSVVVRDSASDASLNVNTNQAGAGRLGLVLALPVGKSFSAGTHELFRVTFSASGDFSGASVVTFADQPVLRSVSDASAHELATTYRDITISIGSLPTLRISRLSEGARLSWPRSLGGYQLQVLDQFPFGQWTNVAGPFGTNEANAEFVFPISGDSKIFRLRSP